jgi:hypothetical protein
MLSQYAKNGPHFRIPTEPLKRVSTPLCGINRLDPQGSYNSASVSAFLRALDAMAVFPNTLGFIAAGQVVNNTASLPAAPVIKTVVRDLKRYMQVQHKNSRQRVLPIGYDSARTTWDEAISKYLCSGDTSSSIDFWTASFLCECHFLHA